MRVAENGFRGGLWIIGTDLLIILCSVDNFPDYLWTNCVFKCLKKNHFFISSNSKPLLTPLTLWVSEYFAGKVCLIFMYFYSSKALRQHFTHLHPSPTTDNDQLLPAGKRTTLPPQGNTRRARWRWVESSLKWGWSGWGVHSLHDTTVSLSSLRPGPEQCAPGAGGRSG